MADLKVDLVHMVRLRMDFGSPLKSRAPWNGSDWWRRFANLDWRKCGVLIVRPVLESIEDCTVMRSAPSGDPMLGTRSSMIDHR